MSHIRCLEDLWDALSEASGQNVRMACSSYQKTTSCDVMGCLSDVMLLDCYSHGYMGQTNGLSIFIHYRNLLLTPHIYHNTTTLSQ